MTARPTTPACWRWIVPDLSKYAHLDAGDRERFWLMLDWQAGRCAICARGGPDKTGPFYADHDHSTGLLRGYLCPPCNTQEGMSDRLIFIRYRQRNPATIWKLRLTVG